MRSGFPLPWGGGREPTAHRRHTSCSTSDGTLWRHDIQHEFFTSQLTSWEIWASSMGGLLRLCRSPSLHLPCLRDAGLSQRASVRIGYIWPPPHSFGASN